MAASGLLFKIKRKWRSDGAAGFFIAIARKLLTPFKFPIAWLEGVSFATKALREQRQANHQAAFPNEDNLLLSYPKLDFSRTRSAAGKKLLMNIENFRIRGLREPLLRRSIFQFIQDGVIQKDKSIIDIGCWIGDNSLPWAKQLTGDAKVYAVDPSEENIDFAQTIAQLNGITNVAFKREVCSDRGGIDLFFEGKITQARFNEDGRGKPSGRTSTTLDNVVGSDNWDSIGFIHIDVEGFEQKVLLGAQNIIEKARPVIVFEQHIAREDPRVIGRWLAAKSYRIYIINEVLRGCNLDCRNYIAFPSEIELPEFPEPDFATGRSVGIWYAAIDRTLVPLSV